MSRVSTRPLACVTAAWFLCLFKTAISLLLSSLICPQDEDNSVWLITLSHLLAPSHPVFPSVIFHFNSACHFHCCCISSYQRRGQYLSNMAIIIRLKLGKMEWKLYLVCSDGYINENVDKVTQSQAGNQGIGAVPHALISVYNPQESGVANQANHKHYNWNCSVDVLKIVINRSHLQAHWRWYQPLYDSFIWRTRHHSLCISPWGPQVDAGPRAWTDGAVETCRLDERALLRFSTVYLAHSAGCHTGH